MSNEPVRPGDLIDVSGISLAELSRIDQSAFAHALRHLLETTQEGTEPFAGFNQSIDTGTEPLPINPQ